jgi:hypothetical protein
MRYLRKLIVISSVLFWANILYGFDEQTGEKLAGNCTIGVFGGSVTSDGRPLLWKNRDVPNSNQRFIYVGSYIRDDIITIPYTGNVYSSDSARVYMGVNAYGFAIINSDSYNLDDSLSEGIDDGNLMRIALETCSDIADFEALLDSTGESGRKNCWNLGVLDASGGCALYECSNFTYRKFVPDINELSGCGYIIRANFSLSGGEPQLGFDRYKRAIGLTEDRLFSGESVDERFVLRNIMRDLANNLDNPYPLPYSRSQAGGPDGYIYNFAGTISNNRTSSAAVIKGVIPGENPLLSTMYAVIGSPDLSLAYPLWVGAETVPIYLSRPDSTPMYEYCRVRRDRLYDNPDWFFFINSKALCDEFRDGFYSYTLPLENWGLERVALIMEDWRLATPPNLEMAVEQFYIARAIFTGFQQESAENIGFQQESAENITENYNSSIEIPGEFQLANYPNPFNGSTRISFNLPVSGSAFALRIYDSLGRLVKTFTGTDFTGNSVIWYGDVGMEMIRGGIVSAGEFTFTACARIRYD